MVMVVRRHWEGGLGVKTRYVSGGQGGLRQEMALLQVAGWRALASRATEQLGWVLVVVVLLHQWPRGNKVHSVKGD